MIKKEAFIEKKTLRLLIYETKCTKALSIWWVGWEECYGKETADNGAPGVLRWPTKITAEMVGKGCGLLDSQTGHLLLSNQISDS